MTYYSTTRPNGVSPTADVPTTSGVVSGTNSSSGRDIDEMNHVGYSALKLATRFGHFETVKALLEAGADPMSRDTTGDLMTCLHVAARNGHTRYRYYCRPVEECYSYKNKSANIDELYSGI